MNKDITMAIENFFITLPMPTERKATYVALIPKISTPTKPKHFQPISLCNTLYKSDHQDSDQAAEGRPS